MNTKLDKYLDTVDRHLRPLPASERVDIVKEIKGSMIDSVFRLGLPYVDSIGIFIPGRTLNPFFEFAGCLLIGILLYLAGRGCWKLLLLYCQNVSKTKEHFAI